MRARKDLESAGADPSIEALKDELQEIRTALATAHAQLAITREHTSATTESAAENQLLRSELIHIRDDAARLRRENEALRSAAMADTDRTAHWKDQAHGAHAQIQALSSKLSEVEEQLAGLVQSDAVLKDENASLVSVDLHRSFLPSDLCTFMYDFHRILSQPPLSLFHTAAYSSQTGNVSRRSGH